MSISSLVGSGPEKTTHFTIATYVDCARAEAPDTDGLWEIMVDGLMGLFRGRDMPDGCGGKW
eukprot:8374128-Pyramimonas_sp.AAC.1